MTKDSKYKLYAVVLIGIFVATQMGGRQPFIPVDGLMNKFFMAYLVLVSISLGYFYLIYRQTDEKWNYGWKLVRRLWLSKDYKNFIVGTICLPFSIVLIAYFLPMPTEVALGMVARYSDGTSVRIAAKCETSYRNRIHGTISELTLEDGRKVKLYGFDYLCGNRVGAPIDHPVKNMVLIARASRIGLWVDQIEYISR